MEQGRQKGAKNKEYRTRNNEGRREQRIRNTEQGIAKAEGGEE